MKIFQIGRLGALLLSVLALIATSGEIALGQSLAWAKRAGGANFDQGEGISVDSAGNSHVTGWFTGSATFGPGEANETTLTSVGSDVFVAKYGGNGSLLWVRQASGPPENRGEAIAVDGAGNSYVTGVFRFGITFHNGTALPGFASGVTDLFVVKYDGSGNLVWARQAGLDFIPGVVDVGKHGRGISVDSDGASYVTGHFGTDLGEMSVFVAKYDTNGNLLWVKHASNDGVVSSLATGSAISVDAAGASYVTGRFSGSITFGPGEATQMTLTSAGFYELFVAKYSASGTLLWARRAGGVGSGVEGEGISVDSAGNSHVTGSFSGNATFGPGGANETTLIGVSVQQDIFLAKYDTSGALVWAKQASGPGNNYGLAISVDGAGNSHVTGGFEISVTFGPGEANETTLINATPVVGGLYDILVAKYEGNGVLVWAKQASGPKTEAGRGIGVDNLGNSYVTGVFGDVSGSAGDPTSVIFGLGEKNETTLTTGAGSGTEIFVAKYQNDSAPPPPPPGVNAQIDAVIVTISDTNLLPSGTKTGLTVKLQAALTALSVSDTATACSKLQDFLNQVKAQRGKKIPEGLADSLTSSVSAIRSVLGCS
jgi:hypothetical protein